MRKQTRRETSPVESSQPDDGATSRATVAEGGHLSRQAGLSRRAWLLVALLCLGIVAALSCRSLKTNANANGNAPVRRTPVASLTPARLGLRVHASYRHDPEAFTQGLVWDQGRLFESTGLIGESSLREVALETGEVLRRVDNDSRVFSEGLALVGDSLVQLTWQDERAMVFDRQRLTHTREFRYRGEGWGLCYDGRALVMSDGTDSLSYRDPKTFALQRKVRVTRAGSPQHMLNELECVAGKVYANVWQSDEIVRIAADGQIDAVIDAAGLLNPSERARADVLNGIAYLKERGRFLVTGKRWPRTFEVSFEPAR